MAIESLTFIWGDTSSSFFHAAFSIACVCSPKCSIEKLFKYIKPSSSFGLKMVEVSGVFPLVDHTRCHDGSRLEDCRLVPFYQSALGSRASPGSPSGSIFHKGEKLVMSWDPVDPIVALGTFHPLRDLATPFMKHSEAQD